MRMHLTVEQVPDFINVPNMVAEDKVALMSMAKQVSESQLRDAYIWLDVRFYDNGSITRMRIRIGKVL